MLAGGGMGVWVGTEACIWSPSLPPLLGLGPPPLPAAIASLGLVQLLLWGRAHLNTHMLIPIPENLPRHFAQASFTEIESGAQGPENCSIHCIELLNAEECLKMVILASLFLSE